MNRRQFISTSLATYAGASLLPHVSCSPSSDQHFSNPFPRGRMPKKLFVVKLPSKMNWHEKSTFVSFQGLVNRTHPRVYMLLTKYDQTWVEYYQRQFNIDYEILNDPYQLFEMFAHEIAGQIVYDPRMPHTLNIATTIGSLKNAIPVSADLVEKFSPYVPKKVDDLSGRWPDLYEAYEWALAEIKPQCNQTLIAEFCVHNPHWPTSTFMNRDYAIAHRLFCIDVSSSERDKKDYALLKKIYGQYDQETLVIGWHCVRDKEHEAVALASEFGHYSMCNLHTANMTVHASIELEPDKKFKQRSVRKNDLKLEDKVYVAFMTTDGDASWFMINLPGTDWADPAHGQIKYNWGFLPLAYHLLPGTVQYYLDNLGPNDFFVAGPSGATYTYSHLHPDPVKFLKLSRYYMDRCGLNTVHMTNWNDRDWWQEVDLPEYPKILRENLPNCVGYVRGMGESAFEKNYITGGKPYIFCGEGIHKGSDVYQTMRDFIDACPNRPLFIYNLVNHSVPMGEIKAAMDRFSNDEVELVHLDELLLLVEKAYEQGRITEELYPERDGLRKILAKEAKAAWPNFFNAVNEFRNEYKEGEAAYVENLRQKPIGLENVVAGEMLAFTTIWHGMQAVKLSLESRGIYVNYKPTANKNFLSEFSTIPDVALVVELQELWDGWHNTTVSFEQARGLADRLVILVESINEKTMT